MKDFVPATLPEKYFAAISAIPRLSEYEKQASDYVCAEAARLGLEHTADDLGNVIVWKPASCGREDEPSLILQAHLDMVGVRSPESNHDFTRDSLELFVDDEGNLRAKDTTLGADDGYGCAYLLSAMAEEFSHPPLELVFTVQEENGCRGAKALDCSKLSAKRMIGLDVMGEGVEYTCCTGCYYSDKLKIKRKFDVSPVAQALRISLTGVQPVRTGALVHPELGNAIKLMSRLLLSVIEQGAEIRLCEISGGEAENYNPVSCSVALYTTQVEELKLALSRELMLAMPEIQDGTQQIKLDFESLSDTPSALSIDDSRSLLELIYLLPSGTVAISPKDDTMLATSNVGIVELNDGAFTLIMSTRAFNIPCKDGIRRRVEALSKAFGCECRVEVRYASWQHNPYSPLLIKTAQLMKKTYGHDMIENICPGGLECCDLLPKIPDLDIVMFAPIGGECHSTGEWMNIASFNRVYVFLKQLLERL